MFMKNNKKTKLVFRGVFARDTLPRKLPKIRPCAYICNIDEIRQPGRHWVCLYFPKKKPNEYYDSFGFPPHKDFLKLLGKAFKCNNHFHQYPLSTSCGQFCMFYILQRISSSSMEEVLKLFDKKELMVNEMLVKKTMKDEFNFVSPVFDSSYIRSQICKSFSQCGNFYTKAYIEQCVTF